MSEYVDGCVHCPGGFALVHYLEVDDLFWTVCDVQPLTEGHIEVITREHVSCMGALPAGQFQRYEQTYSKVTEFLKETYGDFAVFEHGIAGQTVFHSHVHFLPCSKQAKDAVPEKECIRPIEKLDELRQAFQKHGKYLFFSLNNKKFLVDTKISQPRFFRDRFAAALGSAERGNWKETEKSAELMETFDSEMQALKNKWNRFFGFSETWKGSKRKD